MDECIFEQGRELTPLERTEEKPRRAEKRRRYEEKGRDPYDGLRPWSAITHGVGAALAVWGTAALLIRAVSRGLGPWAVTSFAIYGAAMIWLYTASTLYHCLRTPVRGRLALRKLDHVSIYLLIAGTYTPLCLVPLRTAGAWGWTLFGVIWGLAVLGAVMTLFWVNSPRWVTSGVYLFMGWLAVIALAPLWRVLGGAGLFWLLFGGILYTVGGVLYAVKWPGRNNPRFGCHEIFHVFIVLGSAAHFMLMYHVVAMV